MIDLKNKKIVVTGATGFVGGHLVKALTAAGALVVTTRVDILDTAKLRALFSGAFAVVHQAAVPPAYSNQHIAESELINVNGTLAVFDAARLASVDRVIYASSVMVYGNSPVVTKVETMLPTPASPWALQKWTAEQWARLFYDLHHLKTIGLRYSNVFGPGQSFTSPYALAAPTFVATIGRGERPKVLGDGWQTRDFVFIDDVVAANLLALTADHGFGEVYNIANGESLPIIELINKIGQQFGRAVDPEYLPARAGDVLEMKINIDKAKAVLGYQPEVAIDAGLKLTVADYLCGVIAAP